MLQRLSPIDGTVMWQRLVTPTDLNETFEARSAWLDGDKLRVLAWTRFRSASLAQLNPQTGSIISISTPLPLAPSSLQLWSLQQFPFGHRWLHVFGSVSGGSFRSAIKVEPNGELTGFNLGASRLLADGFVSEATGDLATNEGVRWYHERRIANDHLLSAYAFPTASLSQPLSISYSLGPSDRSEFSSVVQLSVGNGNAVAARGARLHTHGLDCPEVGSRGTFEFDVPANTARRISCSVALDPIGDPVSLMVLLRQPVNGVIATRLTELPIQARPLLRNGFE